MKKNFKLVLALVLSVMMIAGMIPAMAEPTALTDYAIVIDSDKTGHTYEAYQIFTGDISNDGTQLSNVQWGSGIKEAGQTALYNKYSLTGDNQTAAKVAEAIATANGAQAMAEAITIANLQSGTALAAIPEGGVSYTSKGASQASTVEHGYYAQGLAAGYYLILDKPNTTVSGSNDFYSNFIVEVLDNVAATPKGSTTTVDKKVGDTNDSVANTNNTDDYDVDGSTATQKWKSAADYDIGDTIPFQLTATLADSVSMYTTYTFTFNDTLSKGLTYTADSWSMSFLSNTFNKDNLTKTINEATVTVTPGTLANYNGSDTKYTDGHVMTWTVTITAPTNQKLDGAFNGAQAVITYNATLNSSAVIGVEGNPNEVDVTFSNNPNGDGTGKTPESEVTVFSFDFKVNKVDEAGKPLANAAFTLKKWNPATSQYETYQNGSETYATAVYTKTADTALNAGKDYYTKSGDNYTKVESPVVGDIANYYELSYTANFAGLDAGKYQITETQTPDGYNTIGAITFEVTESEGKVNVTNVSGATIARTDSDGSNGILATTIENKGGATLPSTGGIGTTIFYIGGSILVLAAAILLITKRRMSNND